MGNINIKTFLPKMTIVISVVFILTGIILQINKYNDHKYNYEKLINTTFLNEKVDKEALTKYLNVDDVETIVYGKNSVLRRKPEKEIIKKYNLEEYEKKQEQYVKKLEKKIKSSFNYKSKKKSNKEVNVSIKLFNVQEYSLNIEYLKGEIIDMCNINEELVLNNPDEYEAISYKAKIKAMYIFDEYIEQISTNENFVTIDKSEDEKKNNLKLYKALYENNSIYIDNNRLSIVKENALVSKQLVPEEPTKLN